MRNEELLSRDLRLEAWFPLEAKADIDAWVMTLDGSAGRLVRIAEADACLVVQLEDHETNALHLLAESLVSKGHDSVVVDGEHFVGEASFLAFTEYRTDGRSTAVFDPVRGVTSEEQTIERWLSEYRHFDGGLEAFALYWGRLESKEWWLSVNGRSLIRPTDAADVRAGKRVLEFKDAPGLQCAYDEADPTPRGTLSAMTLMVGLPLVLSGLFARFVDPVAAPQAGMLLVLLIGWLAFLPLRWSSGRKVAVGWRVLAFVVAPVVLPLIFVRL